MKRDSQTELNPIKEKLSFKWNVVDCLEKLLVSTRLQTAEQEEIINELKRQEVELTKDVTLMKAFQPSSVSTWQEEFLDARLKEAEVNLEFVKIRRDLKLLKKEVDEAIEVTIFFLEDLVSLLSRLQQESKIGDEDGSGDFFSIRLNIKDKHHEKLKSEQDESTNKTNKLQAEADRLKLQVGKRKYEDVQKIQTILKK